MPDGITVSFQTTPAFDRGISALVYQAGLNAKKVVAKETAEVIKSLVRLSPPKSLERAKGMAERDIRGHFRPMPKRIFSGSQANGGLRWLYASPQALLGAEHKDIQLDADPLRAIQLMKIKRKFKEAYAELGQEKKTKSGAQKVMLLNRTILSRSNYNALIKEIKSRFGKMRASWLISVKFGKIQLTGHSIPQWVSKNIPKARGGFVDGLEIRNFPKFTIISKAVGVSKPTVRGIIQTALKIRAKAMQKNALLFMSGKKKLADYSK